MKEPKWIETDLILSIHDELLAWFGGAAGIRDEGMLESALQIPIQRFHYEAPSLCELAASYADGIVRNYPFVDGNKRTGFVTAALFLESNGLRLIVPEEEAVIMTLGLAAGEIDSAAYGRWLEAGTKPR